MLDKAYKEMCADIKPGFSLVEQTKALMYKAAGEKHIFQPKWIIRAGTAGAAVLVAAAIVTTVLLYPQSGIVTSSQPRLPVASNGDGQNIPPSPGPTAKQVPDWYRPGSLRVTTLNRLGEVMPLSSPIGEASVKPMSLKGTALTTVAPVEEKADEIKIPAGYGVRNDGGFVGSDYIQIEELAENGEHRSCTELYYNIRTGEMTCYTHAAREAMKKAGYLKGKDDVYVNMANPYTGDSLILLHESDKQYATKRFLCKASGEVKPLPECSRFTLGYAASPDHKYYIFVDEQGKYKPDSTLWLVTLDGENTGVKDVTKSTGKSHFAGEENEFFADGRFAKFNIASSDGGIYHGNAYESWILYDTRTNKAIEGRGDIIRCIGDGTSAIVNTPDGKKMLDLTTGEDVTKTARLEGWEKLEVVSTSRFSARLDYYQSDVKLVSWYDESFESVPIRDSYQVMLQKDEYVYFYTHGDEAIQCFSMQTQESFYKPVNPKWLTEATAYDMTRFKLDYDMQLSLDGTEVLLSYQVYTKDGNNVSSDYNPLEDNTSSTVSNPDTPSGNTSSGYYPDSSSGANISSAPQVIQSNPSISSEIGRDQELQNTDNIYAEFINADCLADMESFIKEGAERGFFKILWGDGFTGVWFWANPGNYVAVEDYRDGTFTMYRYPNSEQNLTTEIFDIQWANGLPGGKDLRKKLDAHASQADSRRIFAHTLAVEAPYDYKDVYTDGKVDPTKVRQLIAKKSREWTGQGAVVRKMGDTWGPDLPNTDLCDEILKLAAQKSVIDIHFNDSEFHNDKILRYDVTYWMYRNDGGNQSERLALAFGRSSKGKPFIHFKGYSYITEEEYNTLLKLCLEAY